MHSKVDQDSVCEAPLLTPRLSFPHTLEPTDAPFMSVSSLRKCEKSMWLEKLRAS